MNRQIRNLLIVVGALVLVLAVAGPLAVILNDPSKPEIKTPSPDAASLSAGNFFSKYLDGEGRVGEPGQASSTSEAQAEAMLIAAAAGQQDRFDKIWAWSRDHLVDGEGLLADKWTGTTAEGKSEPGANLEAIRALHVAATKFPDNGYAQQASAMSATFAARFVRPTDNGQVITSDGSKVDVFDARVIQPRAISEIAASTNDPLWKDVLTSQRRFVASSIEPVGKRLVPDSVPTNETTQYADSGRPAQLATLWLSDSCEAADKETATSIWRVISAERNRRSAAVLTHSGDVRDKATSVVATSAAAAGAKSAGESTQMNSLLDLADQLQTDHPTLQGGAAVALARIVATTDWLGAC